MDRIECHHDPADSSTGTHGLPTGVDRPPPLHPLVAAACEALESVGVRWALLRGERELLDPRGDVDILMDDARDLHAVERALRPLGIVAVPQLGAGAHRLFVGYHRPTRRWIELDIEWDLDFGPQLHFALNWLAPALRSGAAQAVLSRRRRAPDLPGMWVLHPDDGFWALLLHAIVDKAVVAERHADRLLELCEYATPTSPLAELVTAACPEGWDAERVIRCARARDWAALLDLGRGLPGRVYARRPLAHRARALVRGLHRLGIALGPVLVRRGSSVAVLGPDAAGRAALAAGLVSERPLAARLVDLRLRGDDPEAPVPVWRAAVVTAGRPLPPWRHYLLATYHRLRGCTIVFDVSVQDALVAPTRPRAVAERTFPRSLARICPRSDLVIVLDRPSSVTDGRPPEGDPGHSETLRRRYIALAERLRADVVRADRPGDDVLADAVAIVWKARTGRRAS